MIRTFLSITAIALVLTSCVSSKKYKDLEEKKNHLNRDNVEKTNQIEKLTKDNAILSDKITDLEANLNVYKLANKQLNLDIAGLTRSLELTQASYDDLLKNSTANSKASAQKNRELLVTLEKKENELALERNRLDKLKEELDARSGKINELEEIIASKQKKMNDLKNSLSKALYNFENKGLTVETKNGKVYVSMENKLLFKSGSWTIGSDGKKAITEIGLILSQQPEIALIIEGHTDNEPFPTSGNLTDNWDLSTKRATEIVRLFESIKGIDLKNITAAGRGEFSPVADNTTTEGKAKNRRIEFILAPKLDQISEMLSGE